MITSKEKGTPQHDNNSNWRNSKFHNTKNAAGPTGTNGVRKVLL